jgi:hypothetical protein
MNVDQSVVYNAPIGWDPNEVQKKIKADQERRALPRIPVGS